MSGNYGAVVQIIGPSVDIRFDADQLPEILTAIRIDDADRNTPPPREAASTSATTRSAAS